LLPGLFLARTDFGSTPRTCVSAFHPSTPSPSSPLRTKNRKGKKTSQPFRLSGQSWLALAFFIAWVVSVKSFLHLPLMLLLGLGGIIFGFRGATWSRRRRNRERGYAAALLIALLNALAFFLSLIIYSSTQ